MSNNICPICNMEANVMFMTGFFAECVKCENCGIFYLEDSISSNMSWKTKACINHYLMINKEDNESKKLIPHFHNNNWEDGIVDNRIIISEHEVLKLLPQTQKETTQKILLNLATRLKYKGNTFITYFSEEDEYLFPVFFIVNDYGKNSLFNQLEETLEDLKENGYVKHVRALGDNQNSYTLTPKGWQTVEIIKNSGKLIADKSRQCFIAMWFDSEMEKAQIMIEKAIHDCKYDAMIISKKEHNNLIVPEILSEIENSKFIIADLTGNRGGVYYEAGYAKGLGKEVILSCRSEDFNDRHFDIAQVNTIRWDTEEELYESLVKRIRETIN